MLSQGDVGVESPVAASEGSATEREAGEDEGEAAAQEAPVSVEDGTQQQPPVRILTDFHEDLWRV